MIKQLGLDFKNTKDSFDQLKFRLLFLLTSLLVFRIGSFITIPGIDQTIFKKILEHQHGTIIEMFNMFSGGSLSRASIFALGIMPYVSASIVIQLLTTLHPSLSEIKKEGEAGRRKINKYTRYCTLILAIIQSVGIAINLPNMLGMHSLLFKPGMSFYFSAILSLVTGTVFLMWLGEQITERGIGNGTSIIIFAGIIAGLPPAIGHTIEQAKHGDLNLFSLILIIVLIFIVTYFVIFIERGQRRILANYAKRQQGRRMYAVQCTHLPLKVNMAGVIPAIFASSIILFPATMAAWFGNNNWKWLNTFSLYLQPGNPLYILIYSSAIIFFCFFYTALVFNPRETADNLKKSGAFIPGIRPGEQTAKYINKVMTRLTLVGAFYMTFICLIPEFMRGFMNVPFYFGGTSLLIVVVVIMDFISQLQTLVMSNQYDLALKKANFKGFNK
ncbi:preprotein translocase subunit SecY [Candidatus Pantoea edessiphila]|uniref:Protein translocase subunit SecY n=1 Tax=Candidatus Pantoea edessiphila TaxID=2044610 RepID=A0A2P5SY17_9GAMM|nr:preprotein translocase subunit SecY [Candidatus Pantoea edessiphila]MBK4775914.1 preprotein translocase subunit SecY [Pantoea sp. Edef]PPI87193.1 preprotein translocase subunit SecY [Candidatus Pantoea edessiphila]